jgi:hypothetical protein
VGASSCAGLKHLARFLCGIALAFCLLGAGDCAMKLLPTACPILLCHEFRFEFANLLAEGAPT